jgi:hypothetical protein
METPLHRLLGRVLPPILPRDMQAATQQLIVEGAEKIGGLPVPYRPHIVPFTDELPARPLRSAWLLRLMTVFVLLALWIVARTTVRWQMVPKPFHGAPLGDIYTVWEHLDGGILRLTNLSKPGLGGTGAAQRLQRYYSQAMLASTVLVWVVEANRRGNYQSLVGRILIW